MRLIDADALMEALNKSDRDARTDADIQGYCDGWNDVVEIIDEQPIAYDVDKVVAELEVQKEKYEKDSDYWDKHSWKDTASHNDCYLNSEKADCFGEAIEIVRKGGAS